MEKNKTVPQVPGEFLIGNLRQYRHNPFQAVCDWHRDYGDLLGFKLAKQQVYLFSHPNLIEQALVKQNDVFIKMYNPDKASGLALVLGQGLVTSQGQLWRQQRRLIQPVFQRSNLTTMLSQMIAAGKKLLDRWQQLGDDAEVNLSNEMMRLTIEVITQTMFSTSVMNRIEQIGPALDTCLRYAAKTISNPLMLPLFIPTPANQEFKKATALLDEIIYDLLAQRRAQALHQPDLLAMLLAAGDNAEAMSDQQIRDELITIFTAGHETTSNLLTWTLYLLARNPKVLSALRAELEHVLQGKTPGASDFQQLIYTRAVLSESMRIRPPVGFTMRKVARDTEVDGYAVTAGSLAMFSIYNLHHHAKFWSEPEAFNPARFLSAEKRRFSYMPFGTGERICVGNHFALMESQLLLSMIVQHYDVQLLNTEEVEIEMAVSLRPKGGIPVRLKRR